MQGTVIALFVAPQKKAPLVPLQEVEANASGFVGDFHSATATRRQILMISDRVLKEFELEAGALRENMVLGGVDVMNLEAGQLLHLGDTVLEVTIPCEPCVQMERVKHGLKKALDGKRGMFARVITAGTIRVGDAVRT